MAWCILSIQHWAPSYYKDRLPGVWGFPCSSKIRRSLYRRIFNMGITILMRHLYIETPLNWMMLFFPFTNKTFEWHRLARWVSRARLMWTFFVQVSKPTFRYMSISGWKSLLRPICLTILTHLPLSEKYCIFIRISLFVHKFGHKLPPEHMT